MPRLQVTAFEPVAPEGPAATGGCKVGRGHLLAYSGRQPSQPVLKIGFRELAIRQLVVAVRRIAHPEQLRLFITFCFR